MTATIKQKTVSGFKWVAFSRYAQKGVSVVTFIILARLLEPRIFGLFAMAFILIDGLGLFKNLGVDAALVQRNKDIEKAAHTAFWMMPFMGLFIFVILYVLAPFAAVALKEESLTPIIRVLGIIFVLGAMENIPVALLTKELHFKDLAVRELVSAVLFSVSALLFAVLQLGIWSLVYAYLLKRISMFYFSWSLSKYRPQFVFDKQIAKDLLHFGKFIFGASAVGFLIANTDNFLVGRIMGATTLGYYALAYNISTLTTQHLSGLVNQVMFPAYSKIQDTRLESKRFTLKIMSGLAMFSFPFGVSLILFAEEMVRIVYGARWLPLVPPLKALALCSMLLPLSSLAGATFSAGGKPKWIFYMDLFIIGGMIILIPFWGSLLGLLGVGLAVTFSKISVLPVVLRLLDRSIGLKSAEIFHELKPILIASFFMAVSGYILQMLMANLMGGYSVFLYGTLSAIIYIASLYWLDKPLIHRILDKVFNRS
ncbi:MAG: lipopolysaccharide biosynthesis protein [Candidatus Omnitrophota bacterium]